LSKKTLLLGRYLHTFENEDSLYGAGCTTATELRNVKSSPQTKNVLNAKKTVKGKMTMKIFVHSNTYITVQYIILQILQHKNIYRELNSLANLSQLAREEELLSEVILKGPLGQITVL
jgi:hypothetical protein